jgi:hypothetical protein
MNQPYVYFSRFEPDVNSNGGRRRLAQMKEVLELNKFEFFPFRSTLHASNANIMMALSHRLKKKMSWLESLDRYLVTDGEYQLWHEDHRHYVYSLRLQSREWARLIDKSWQLRLAMVDDPIYFSPLVKKLKLYDIPIIAMCHNLETLSAGQVEQRHQRALFDRELNLLSLCDLVMAISREETFLLNNLGINTVYFPYYPARAIVNRMLDVRKSRQETIKQDVILLGTASNKPTRDGMIIAMKMWQALGLSRTGGRLLVAGFGTDILRDLENSDVEILGTLTNEELDKRLSTVKACMCYQEKASGALTRIAEMLIAGVPVLANSHAARSYHNLKGVLEFSHFEELGNALQKIQAVEGNIPVPPVPDLSFLTSQFKRFMQ